MSSAQERSPCRLAEQLHLGLAGGHAELELCQVEKVVYSPSIRRV